MSYIKNNNKYLAYNEDEPPTKKIISEGDILIKELANKQQNKNITLQECMQDGKHFEKLSEHISFMSCYSGVLTLEKFKTAVEQLKSIEDLRSCNLTNNDVKLMLDYKDGTVHKKYKNIEPDVLQSRLKTILQTIQEFKEKQESNSNVKTISHNQHESLAMKPDSKETKLLKFALENKNNCCEKIAHPMDNIKCIEADLFSHLEEDKLNPSRVQKQIRRYADKVNSKLNITNYSSFNNGSIDKSEYCFVNKSKWDQQNDIEQVSSSSVTRSQKNYTCKLQNYYTIKNGQIIKLQKSDVAKRINIQTAERLTAEEIKEIPKFKNYGIGHPSKTLYLKNLPKYIKESHLNEIFSEIALNNTLSIRIMTGKMKGQAFVTFPDVNLASQALDLVNGTLVDEKPLVIEFGKK